MAPVTKLAPMDVLALSSFDPTWAEVLAWHLSPLWIAIQLRPHLLCGQVPIRASHRAYACVVSLSVLASLDTMLISFPTEFQCFDTTWEKGLHRLVLCDYAWVPVPSRATYGRLSPSWPVEALGPLSFTSLCMCSCTKQSDLWSPVTSLAGGAGWRGLVCLGPTLGFRHFWRVCAKVVSVSTKQCAMCSGCVKWEASCHQTACSISLWARRLWNSWYFLFSPPARWGLLDFITVVLLLLLLLHLLLLHQVHFCHFHVHFRLANSSPSSSPTSARSGHCWTLNLGPAEFSEHRWTSTWDLPSSVSTAGPQPGTRRAQWAPLDLNLGPAEFSERRWTSTWDLPSSVSTAGPEPVTRRAQWAPLDLNLGPSDLSEHRWTPTAQRPDRMPEDMPDKTPDSMSDRMPEDMPDKMPEDMPDRMPEDMPDRMPEGMPDKVPECLPDRMPEDLPDRMPDRMSEDMPEDMPDRMPDRMSEDMPEDMPDRMPEDMPDKTPDSMSDRMPEDMPDEMPEDMPDRMPDRMPEDMSDRMPDRMSEDLPVTKRINVMVGITRK